MSTSIDTFINERNEDNLFVDNMTLKTEKELVDIIFHDHPTNHKLLAINTLYTVNSQLCMEIIFRLNLMYGFDNTCLLEELLSSVILQSTISCDMLNECCKSLYEQNKSLAYECFNYILNKVYTDKNFSLVLLIEIFKYLFETKIYKENVQSKFEHLITNVDIDCEYRYKTLLNLLEEKERKIISEYIDSAFISFIKHQKTMTRYRIVASQYILQKSSINKKIKQEVEAICISFALDSMLDYNLRADASDLLLRLGSENAQKIGRDIIILLGKNIGSVSTIYTNRQNVHDEQINESIQKFIQFISTQDIKVENGNIVKFEDIQSEIEKLFNTDERFLNIKSLNLEEEKTIPNADKLKSSMLRIYIDKTTYYGQTLKTIFIKIWYLIKHDINMQIRLIEELIDMSDTCTSGHIGRLMNVFSGFNYDFGLQIGWDKQIQSNFIGRLNKKIKDIGNTDVEYMNKILDEMAWSSRLEERQNFNKVFRENLPFIREEMINEFVYQGKYMDEMTFETYFKNTISSFGF